MENSELVSVVSNLCRVSRQLFDLTQDNLLMIAAIQDLMQERGSHGFRKANQEKIREMRRGDFGHQLARDKEAFESALQKKYCWN